MAVEREETHQEPKRNKTTYQSGSNSSSNSSEDSNPSPSLPPEIFFEILSRLPVKSLLQFRSVCKSWCSLISSPQFAKTHLSVSAKGDDYTRHNLLLASAGPHCDLKACSLHSVLIEASVNAVELNYPSKDPHSSVWVVGTCNGLVCLAIEEATVFLWNPSTRISKRLPNSGINLRFGCYVLYGFGYDESNDDYKVVAIFCEFSCWGGCEAEVKVYTLRTDSWRRIQDFSLGIPLDDSGKFVNGALHWLSSRGMHFNSLVIVSLDLANEAYAELAQPNYGDGYSDLTLGVLGGFLSVLCNYPGTHADVWVMKEYGFVESWTKLVTVPYLTGPESSRYSPLVCISKNGEILLGFGPSLIVYNSKDNKFKAPEIHGSGVLLDVDSYIESLVSPVVDNELESLRQ